MPRVVTDGSCGLPNNLLASRRITVVPLSVDIDRATLHEDIDITAPEFYSRMARSTYAGEDRMILAFSCEWTPSGERRLARRPPMDDPEPRVPNDCCSWTKRGTPKGASKCAGRTQGTRL
ncbi:MAG: DegV family protein [Coriobacteriia bacterium]